MTTDTQPELPFELSLDSLSDWLAGLPKKERDRYASLYAGLQALNAAKPEPAFYLKALDKLQAPVFEATVNLTAAFLGKPLPLEPGIRKLAKLGAQFQGELAQGYYAISQAKGFGRIFEVEEQGRVVHRILRFHSQMVLRLVLMYESVPSSSWLRLNEVYRSAERANLLRSADACPELPHLEPCSVEQLYLRLLAFRLAGPYRLGQEEIQRVFDLVQQHGPQISLSHHLLDDGRKADFAVDLDSGGLPSSQARSQGEGKGDLRYLFLGRLRKTFAALGRPPLNKDSGVSSGLSNHLQIRLGEPLDFLPDKKSRSSVLFAGYKNLVRAMSQPEAKPEFTLQSLDEHELSLGGIDLSKTSSAFRPQAKPPAAMPALAVAAEQASLADGFACRVYPASAPGFYLIESSRLELRAGRLLGLFTDNKLIQFGIVCAGMNENAPHAYGFELLAVQVSLVKVCFDASPKKKHPCFLASLGNNNRFSLITEPMRLRGGDGMGIELQKHKGQERYRVAKMLEKTAEFCQFEIVPEAAEEELKQLYLSELGRPEAGGP